MSTHTIKVTESAPIGDGFRLDKDAGIAYGVAVCGKSSLNNRDYPDDVRDRDKAVYEGVDCFIDHAEGNGNRRIHEWFGNIKNPRTRVSDRKTIGDLHYPLESDFAPKFVERCERFPNSFAMSHVATCKTRRKNGRDVIESISKVHSVDLVIGAATNNGIYESVQHPGKPMKFKEYINAALVRFPASASLKSFREMDGLDSLDMPADVSAVDDSMTDADPIKAAFVTAMHGLIDQYDAGDIDDAELMSKFKDVLKAHVKLGGKEAAEPTADDSVPKEQANRIARLTADDSVPKEQANRIARLTVENMALRAGVALSPVQEKAVLGLTDDADRKALVESFKVARRTEKPQSGQSAHGGNGQTMTEQKTEPAGPTWYEPDA